MKCSSKFPNNPKNNQLLHRTTIQHPAKKKIKMFIQYLEPENLNEWADGVRTKQRQSIGKYKQ